MKTLFLKVRWLSMGAVVGLTLVTLWAQEAQQFNRGINVIQGNITTSRGYMLSASPVRDVRTNTVITGTSQTYTAAQVLAGYITRNSSVGASTDVLPTAANLAAAIPGVVTGHSFFLVIDPQAGNTITLNGASTGVTYAGGCATAMNTSQVMLVLINFTSTTAYRAACMNVGV